MIARYPKSGKTADYLENWFYQHLKVVSQQLFLKLQLNDVELLSCVALVWRAHPD